MAGQQRARVLNELGAGPASQEGVEPIGLALLQDVREVGDALLESREILEVGLVLDPQQFVEETMRRNLQRTA